MNAKDMRVQRSVLASFFLAGFVFLLMACGQDTGMAAVTPELSRSSVIEKRAKAPSGMTKELRAAYLDALQEDASIVTVTEKTKLLSGNVAAEDRFGTAVAISDDGLTAVIGAPYDDDRDIAAGAAYFFSYDGAVWKQEKKVVPTGPALGAHFGKSVALSGDGATAFVGAPGEEIGGIETGVVHVFTRQAIGWAEQTKLVASDGDFRDEFGTSLSISGDYAIVGAPSDDDKGSASGSAYVFMRTGTNWTQKAKLVGSTSDNSDYFGLEVALSGNNAVIWSLQREIPGSNERGSAYAFVNNGTAWIEQELIPNDGSNVIGVNGVALSGDAIFLNTDDGVYPFHRVSGAWVQQPKLLAFDGTTIHTEQIAAAGNTVIVGSYPIWYSMARDINGIWTARDSFSVDEPVQVQFSVALSMGAAIFGAPLDNGKGNMAGAAYVSKHNNGTFDSGRDIIEAGDAPRGGNFGASVAMDNDFAVIGASGDSDYGDHSGAAYVLRHDGQSWKRHAKLTANDAKASEIFGISVAMEGGTIVIRSKSAAYMFEQAGTEWMQKSKFTAGPVASGPAGASMVAVSGSTAIVGEKDIAKIYVRDGDQWGFEGSLTSSTMTPQFGQTVDLFADTAIVGHVGGADIFVRNNKVWTLEKTLTVDNGAGDFGACRVNLATNLAVVGAPAGSDNGLTSGAVHVFVRNQGAWEHEKALFPADSGPYDFWGWSVAAIDDLILVGGIFRLQGVGDAHVFRRDQTGWHTDAQLLPMLPDEEAWFGWSVALSSNGTRALIGAIKEDDEADNSGSTYAISLTRLLGTSCIDGRQCQSGFCIDNVCCDSPCEGACRACTQAIKGPGTTDGYCGNILDGDPDPDYCEKLQSDNLCGYTGTCFAGTCAVAPFDVEAKFDEPLCLGNVQYAKQICNGLGDLVPDPTSQVPCGAYNCDTTTTECKKSCTVSDADAGPSDCAPGFECRNKICVSSPECSSSEDCTDDYVCDIATLRCVPAQSTGNTPEDACDCRTPGHSSSPHGYIAVVMGLTLLGMRSRRRHHAHFVRNKKASSRGITAQ